MRFSNQNRRAFLHRSAAAAFLSAHGLSIGQSQPAVRATEDLSHPEALGECRITRLELRSAASLADMKKFYGDLLGLPVVEEGSDRLTIAAGKTSIAFLAPVAAEKPFYHFAFNIPENKLKAAHAWQQQRTPLLPIPERLRDPEFPPEVVNYAHWNAHSVFFFDPSENVVEYIARHDLKNGAEGPFTTDDILYASEIAFVVDDVARAADEIGAAAGLNGYGQASEQFAAIGDEAGLLLVMKRGRIISFDSPQTKAVDVFPTTAHIRAGGSREHSLKGFPYNLRLEE